MPPRKNKRKAIQAKDPEVNNQQAQKKSDEDEEDASKKPQKKVKKSNTSVSQSNKGIKQDNDNGKEQTQQDEIEEEKKSNGQSGSKQTQYEIQADSNKLKIQINSRTYEFDLEDQNIKENTKFLNFLHNIKGFFDLLENKEKEKVDKIMKIAGHYHFTAAEYLLKKTLDQLELKKRNINKFEEEKCCICQFELYDEIDSYDLDKFQNQLKQQDDNDAIGLDNCDGHYFHKACLLQMVHDKHIKCPVCSRIYGVMIGDQPEGQMKVRIDKSIRCDGYPNCDTIVIDYNMFSGIRDGKRFPSTYRCAYLPDNKEGREVRDLMKIAFDRKLIFTIGRSVTNNLDHQIVWNGIHQKTNTHGGATHYGWPDPTYFNRVKMELAMKGVM